METRDSSLWARRFDGLLDLTCWLAGVIIVFIMLIVVYEVLSRKFLDRPTTWVVDVSTLSLLMAALLPSAWALKRKAHVNIELFSAKLSEKNRNLVNLITYSLALLGCCVVVWQGTEATLIAYRQSEMLFRSLVIPKVWYIWIFAFSFLLLIIQLLREIVHFYHQYRSGGKFHG